MFKGLRTAIYIVRDIAEAKSWYTKILGKVPYFDEPFYVGFNVGGFELGLLPDESEDNSRTGEVVTYWGVANANESYNELLQNGAKEKEPVSDVGGNILVGTVTTPFGNTLGIIENPHFKFEE